MFTQLHRTASAAVGATVIALGGLASSGQAFAAPATPIPVGTPPNAVISIPSTVWAGIPVTLSGARSTSSSGGVSEWEWNLDGKGGYEYDSLSSPWVSKTFTRGRHTVTLRVRNTAGLVDTTTKTFTAKKPPAAVAEPTAPPTVTAVADGTAVDVTWAAPLEGGVLAYRVTNGDDSDTDPIYVPGGSDTSTRFDDLVPGEYRIRVSAINAAGTGPGTEATARVIPKGGVSSSATPSATASATTSGAPSSTASVDPTTTDAAASTASGSGDNRDTIGIVLIALGAVVLVGAGVTAAVTAWRRRRAA